MCNRSARIIQISPCFLISCNFSLSLGNLCASSNREKIIFSFVIRSITLVERERSLGRSEPTQRAFTFQIHFIFLARYAYVRAKGADKWSSLSSIPLSESSSLSALLQSRFAIGEMDPKDTPQGAFSKRRKRGEEEEKVDRIYGIVNPQRIRRNNEHSLRKSEIYVI